MSRLRTARLHPAAIQSLRHWFRIHHTYHSNAIEGNRLTLPETRAVIEDGITIAGKPLKDHLEAVNLAEALDFVESLSSQTAPLGEREVRDIHAIVLRGIDRENAGAYRLINVRIGGTDYVPPGAVAVPERMGEFGRWLASDKPEHPIVIAAIAHTWFETIHPFVDGNGRTGRLLANLLLMRHGYPVTLLRVEERARYYTALDQSHSGELTSMVELTLESVERSLTEYERSMGELKVQEPTIEYLAERLATVQKRSTPTGFISWKYAVESLQENLRETARKISERLEGKDSGVELSVQPVAVTEQIWREAQLSKTGSLHRLVSILGKRHGEEVSAWLAPRPPGEYRWLESAEPLIYLMVHAEPADNPERFILAVPHEHLFHAAYATSVGRAELKNPFGRRLNPQGVPPPGVTLKKDVSALQIATDIWTYLIENFLSG
jgi:Fic family protein